MPAGRVHEKFNMAALGFLGAPVALTRAVPEEVLLAGVGGYLFGTFLVTPDMDQAGKGSSRALQRWGVLAGLWLPYGLFFRHRGLSHVWPVGPLTRLVYLLAPVYLVLAQVTDPFRLLLHPYFLAALAGFLLADLLHALLDRLEAVRRAVWFLALVPLLVGSAWGSGLGLTVGVEASARADLRGVSFPSFYGGLEVPLSENFFLEASGPSPVAGWSVGFGSGMRVILGSEPVRLAAALGYAIGAARPYVLLRATWPGEGLGWHLALLSLIPLEEAEPPVYMLRVGLALNLRAEGKP